MSQFIESLEGRRMFSSVIGPEHTGVKFTANLGKFNYSSIDIILKARINWGDGKVTTGTLKNTGGLASGHYTIVGSHKYGSAGTYNVKVKVLTYLAGSNLRAGTAAVFNDSIAVLKK